MLASIVKRSRQQLCISSMLVLCVKLNQAHRCTKQWLVRQGKLSQMQPFSAPARRRLRLWLAHSSARSGNSKSSKMH